MGALEGKVALITGATSGIGAATARLFAEEGARLMLTGRDADRGAAVLADVRDRGVEAIFMPADLTDETAVGRLMTRARESASRLDILVNSAGIYATGTAEETSPGTFARVMAVNVQSLFSCSRAALPLLRRRGGGVIINLASDWALVGGRRAVAYCASKGAVLQLTRAMALDHAHENIRVNAVCPSDTLTPMFEEEARERSLTVEEAAAESAREIPLGRVATAEEVARAVLYLAGDGASYLTGVALPVDGGNTCQ